MKVTGKHSYLQGAGLKVIISILFIFYSSFSYSNEVIIDPQFDELDEFLEEDLNFISIDSLGDKIDISEKKYRKYKPKEFIRVDPLTPEKYLASLEKGSKMINLKSDKVFFNDRKLYVKAREVYYGGKWSYLISKNGEINYKTHTTNLTSVETVVELRSKIPASKVYPPKTSNHTSDKVFPINSHFLYRSDSSNLNYVGKNLGYTEGNANSNTLSFKMYYESFLPIDFGIVFDYQFGVLNFEDSEESLWNALYIGPTMKYTFIDRGSFAMNTQLAVKKSLLFNVNNNGENVQFSTLLWQIGLEAIYKTDIGNFSIGYDSSFIRSSVKSELPNREPIQSEKETMNQNSISVGYQFTWNL